MRKTVKYILVLFVIGTAFVNVSKASAVSLEMTQKQKESYYKQYANIIEKVNSDQDADLELVPIEDFKPDEWIEPQEFEKIAIDMAEFDFVLEPNGDELLHTKVFTTSINGKTLSININGNFNTNLFEPADRQIFESIDSITSSSNDLSWKQTGYTARLSDLGRSYVIDIGGEFTYNGITGYRGIYVEFYCSATGAIS